MGGNPLDAADLRRLSERRGGFLLLRQPVGDHRPGVYRLVVARWVWFCSRLEVLADTRDGAGRGRVLLITDPDDVEHEWVAPETLLPGCGVRFRERLLGLGLVLMPGRGARDALREYVLGRGAPS